MARKHLRRKSCTSDNVNWRDSLLAAAARLESGALVGDTSGDVGESEPISGSREVAVAAAGGRGSTRALLEAASAALGSSRVACFSSCTKNTSSDSMMLSNLSCARHT